MNTATLNLLTEIVNSRFGFIMESDMPTLMADKALLHCKVLIRAHEERKVVALYEVQAELAEMEAKGYCIRDVAFTADECRRLREHA